ncbi:MAG: LuxR C-terminal-related transcriptional regulator [Paludibacter sp.]|nr:LuxR C-terminal-related transcriptional regulator [Paludibacter sp.]
MGYGFFTEYIHPDDMEVIPESIKLAFAGTSETIFAGMYRFKNKQLNAYNWLYGNCIPLSTFDDGSVRQMLVVAIDITDKMKCDNQLASALRETHKLKHDLKLCNCSKREKDVLNLIIQGKTDKEIAKELFISIATARNIAII